MDKEIIIAVVSAVIGSFITFIFSFLLDKRKEKREDRLEARKERIAIFQNRPKMAVVDYKDYISRIGYGLKQTCDIDLFVAHIDKVTATGNKKNDVVYAHYCDEDFEPKDWCCVIYTLKNAGKTLYLESKKFKSGSGGEYPAMREAIGQLMTGCPDDVNTIPVVAVPYNNKSFELSKKWSSNERIRNSGIRFMLVRTDGKIEFV